MFVPTTTICVPTRGWPVAASRTTPVTLPCCAWTGLNTPESAARRATARVERSTLMRLLLDRVNPCPARSGQVVGSHGHVTGPLLLLSYLGGTGTEVKRSLALLSDNGSPPDRSVTHPDSGRSGGVDGRIRASTGEPPGNSC